MPRGQKYQYQPLAKQRSIRILEIYPLQGLLGFRNTEGRLKEVSLDEAPNYEAVSYVWGTATASQKFHCQDGFLLLTDECWRMIRFMRLKTRSRFLWIDACCIDQDSGEERNHQVGMMGPIYSKARRVLVWLGDPGWHVTHNSSVMRYIREIGQGRSEARFERKDIGDLYQFFKNPWFSRVWTVQEFALSSTCVIMYGSQWFSAEDLIAVFSIKQRLRDATSIDYRQNLELEGLQRFSLHRDLWQYIRDVRASGYPQTLGCTRLLLRIRLLSATDTKDKIYAFQGILAQLGIRLPEPDYSKTTRQIYREAAAASIRHDNDLMLLSSLTGIRSKSIPSWVPDWSIEDPISEIAMWDKQCAAHSSPPIFKISTSQRLITLRGMVIDTVDLISLIFPEAQDLRERADRSETYLIRKDEIRIFQEWFSTFGEAHLAAFFAGFVRDDWARTYRGYSPSPQMLRAFWIEGINRLHHTKRHTETVDHDLPLKIEKLFAEDSTSTTLSLDEVKQSVVQFHAIVRKRCDRKVLFRTHGGDVGIGSLALKSGDKIALFSGCNLPMIIRPQKKYGKMICPAYIQSAIQNCEAWTSGAYLLEDYTFV